MDHMTLVIEEISLKEIFKDTFYQDQISRLWPPKLLLSPIFELDINHGSCICCTPIPKPITTCPLKVDQLKSRPRGRPKMIGVASTSTRVLSYGATI
jgi:hypothetical protein